MQKDWLKRQLTKAKQGAPMWSELAEAIQQLVDNHAMPLIERLRNIKSSFTMAEEDLDKKIGELGRFFAIRAVPADIKPVVFMQRLDEIHLKDTVFPLVNTLWREFNGLSVKWEPLYAPVDLQKHPYGSLLLTKEDMEQSKGRYGDMFLTSRGVIRLPINEIMEGRDFDEMDKVIEKLINEIKVYVEPLLPLHIVFDGHQLALKYVIKEAEEWFYAVSESIGQDGFIGVKEGLEALTAERQDVACDNGAIQLDGMVGHDDYIFRFDDIPMDAWSLDSQFAPFYFSEVMEFSTSDKSTDTLEFTQENGNPPINTREEKEIISGLDFHQDTPLSVPVSECLERIISTISDAKNNLSMADGQEMVKGINNELRNIIKQTEAHDGVTLSVEDLHVIVSEINQQIEHEGYDLRFDVTPLDQCMLDSGHFEP